MVCTVRGITWEMVGGQKTSFGFGLHDESSHFLTLHCNGFFDGLDPALLFGPRLAWWWGAPCILRWQHTLGCCTLLVSIMAVGLMAFLPLALVLAGLNSPIKMNSCGIAEGTFPFLPENKQKSVHIFLTSIIKPYWHPQMAVWALFHPSLVFLENVDRLTSWVLLNMMLFLLHGCVSQLCSKTKTSQKYCFEEWSPDITPLTPRQQSNLYRKQLVYDISQVRRCNWYTTTFKWQCLETWDFMSDCFVLWKWHLNTDIFKCKMYVKQKRCLEFWGPEVFLSMCCMSF